MYFRISNKRARLLLGAVLMFLALTLIAAAPTGKLAATAKNAGNARYSRPTAQASGSGLKAVNAGDQSSNPVQPLATFPGGTITFTGTFGCQGASTINVTNLHKLLATNPVSITLSNFTRTAGTNELDMMLVGPTNSTTGPTGTDNIIFLSDVGGSGGVTNITITINDTGVAMSSAALVNGTTYSPTNLGASPDTFSGGACATAPTPSNPTSSVTFASVFGNKFPNGSWTLYVMDDSGNLNTGGVTWSLTLNTDPSPTAAPADVSGSVTTTDGRPLGGVTMALNGMSTIRTITDASGNYAFRGLNTDSFYTVTPEFANYSFDPSNRSFSLIGHRSDAVFTGTADAIQTQNPLETPEYFVRQQYLDFLGREPDQGGLDFWAGKLRACGSDSTCMSRERINVSAAFFQSEEFQQTGSFIYRLYKAGLGRELSYQEFSQDHARVVDNGALSVNRSAFAASFVTRPEFVQKYSSANTAESFVSALLQTIRQADGVDLSSQRDALVAKYQSGANMDEGRSLALREAIEAASFREAEMNTSFVLTEYFGYLKRDADSGGYGFWLDVLNNRVPGNYQSMVCAFITSGEYQRRFSSVVTRSNSECSH